MELQQVLNGVAEKLAVDFETISGEVSHRLSKGHIRETEIAEQFLRKYLPKRLGLGRGEIIASTGAVSHECDLVVYDDMDGSVLLDKTDYKVFPAECVYGIVEIKSHLDRRELQSALQNIRSAKQLPKVAHEPQAGPVIQATNLYDQEWEYFPTTGFVFAYDSIDLVQLRQELDVLQADVPIHERIDGLWVLKKGAIINWNDATNQIIHTPKASTRLRAIGSGNPLLIMIIVLQQVFQSTWMPKFRIMDYMGNGPYGKPLEP